MFKPYRLSTYETSCEITRSQIFARYFFLFVEQSLLMTHFYVFFIFFFQIFGFTRILCTFSTFFSFNILICILLEKHNKLKLLFFFFLFV